jgi:GT2 family glycosyltransferase
MMSKMPVAGVVWQTIHYLLGFERLGYDAYYVEAHARTPSMLMERDDDDSSALAAGFIDRVMRNVGLTGRWAFHALHEDGRCYGLSESALACLYREATLIVNLHGGTEPRPEHAASGRLVYLESDPCELQVELAEGRADTLAFLEPHAAFFTFGENLGRPDCRLPVPERFHFVPTRQPVLLDAWEAHGNPVGHTFTTIGNWRQAWRTVQLDGETYHWSKHREFMKFIDLPRRAEVALELALSSVEAADVADLEAHGWSVRPGLDVSLDRNTYRSYVSSSRGEFTVAKDQNVRLRSGWFSDRSATYLAAGRPVVTQDTGFGCALPTGAGLFAFTSLDEAVDALQRITKDFVRQSRAAHAIAREFFSHDVVLGAMLAALGLETKPRRARGLPLADDLSLEPRSRRPLALEPETRHAVLARPVPAPAVPAFADAVPSVTIVVVAHDGLVCTRLCVESVLAQTGIAFELLVVDNASTDGTPAYLAELAARDPRVTPILNDCNVGFAAAVNQGLARARGDVLVVLNNDVVVTPGWLEPLVALLADRTIGAVGPVTNRIANEAEIPTHHRTYGEMVEFAAERGLRFRGSHFDIPMLAMFCTALRREVFERVGPLDEQFELGLFEDDDYSHRVRAAGLRLVCADDSFVHHFGEASFGNLVPDGRYATLFERNRERFEHKWGVPWRGHQRRSDDGYARTIARVQHLVRRTVPADAVVAVVSRGDDELLDLGRAARHFPESPDGTWAGHYPGDSEDAIALLRTMQETGSTHIDFPEPGRWWLEHYAGLAAHLRSHARQVVDDPDCIVFELRVGMVPSTRSAALVEVGR